MTMTPKRFNLDIAEKMLARMIRDLSDIAEVEQSPKLEGRRLTMTLRPKKKGKTNGDPSRPE
jgi:translation initiation factor IF-3